MDKLIVTQADREAAAAFYGPHLSLPGEVPVTAHMRAGKIDESPSIQAFAAHRIASQADLVDLLNNMPVDVEFANADLFRDAVNNWWVSDVAPTLATLSHTKGESK